MVTGTAPTVLHFSEFALDAANAELRRRGEVVRVRPKTLAVLDYLAQRPGRLVAKAELLNSVWPDTAVGEWVLTGCVQELRRLLGDDARQPRIIETVHGRGYRFIERPAAVAAATASAANGGLPSALVGRAGELDQLAAWWRRAGNGGGRQVGFIAGEAGIGKTALVDEFVRRLAPSHPPDGQSSGAVGGLVARGQCIEQHTVGEPYLPVLDALGRPCAGGGDDLVEILHRHAPAWLAQLPGLLAPEEAAALERRVGATTGDRMLREFASFVEALPMPLLLIIEDLHWSDNATLDLISMLARQHAPGRLLLLVTYRPAEAAIRGPNLDALCRELLVHESCHHLHLQPLDEAAVASYLHARWPGLETEAALARLVHQHTDGNALFVTNVAEHLSAAGAVAEIDGHWCLRGPLEAIRVGVPEHLRQLIAMRVGRLDESARAALEAGSLVGRTFSAALVAAALDDDVVETERCLARLAEIGHMVQAAGESRWPDGTVSAAYRLTHYLYQAALRERVPPARRQSLHRRMATRLEQAYGERAVEIATDLAGHLEASGQAERAVPYLEEAVQRAVRRGAPHDALALIDHSLGIIDALPPAPHLAAAATRLYLARGMSLVPLRGFGDADIERSYLTARALSEASSDLLQLFHALAVLTVNYVAQARLNEAIETAASLRRRLQDLPVPAAIFAANVFSGVVAYHAGSLADARRDLEAACAVADAPLPAASADVRAILSGYLALTALHQGQPDDSLTHLDRALELARESGRPYDIGVVSQVGCTCLLQSGEVDRLAPVVEIAATLSDTGGFRAAAAIGRVSHGRALHAQGERRRGIDIMRAGIEAYAHSGQRIAMPTVLAALIECHLADGDPAPAHELVLRARSLAETSGEQRYLAELHRLEGEVHLLRGEPTQAARCVQAALQKSREQGERWWELRATMSWYRMQAPANRRTAHRALAALADTFTQGHETTDLKAARTLLATARGG